MKGNLKSLGNILKQEGTSRYERYLPALDPHSVLIDDRKLQDFISYAQRYSKNILFVDNEGNNEEKSANWESFFKSDILLLIANIATKNADYFKATYDYLSSRFNENKTIENFTELVQFVFSRFKKINSWYYSSSPDTFLNSDLQLYIGSYLQKELESLQEIILYIRNIERDNYGFKDFKTEFFNENSLAEIEEGLERENIWKIKDKENIALRERIFAGSDNEEKLSNASIILNKVFDAVFHTTENIIHSCQRYFEDTINQRQDHPPHVALLVAFLKLYGYVQDELNRIPQRHLDFYYREVLQIKAKEAIPDQAYVIFELAKGFDLYEIKKGTEFSAGKDRRNTQLIYEANEDVVINKASISSIYNVFIEQDLDAQTLNYYTNALRGNSDKKAADNSESASSWKIFGERKNETLAEIGFGIASSQFYLAKGERNVFVTFELHDSITHEQFDISILKLLLTGEKGWIDSDNPESGINIISFIKTSSQTLQLNFAIAITQESAIIAYNHNLHEGSFNTSLPVLQCILKFPSQPEATAEPLADDYKAKISQLNLLQKIRLSGTSIQVEVGSISSPISFDGVRDLMLHNNDSVLDPKSPFYPFTSIPKIGSAFYIGCKDFFYKKIDKISLNIAWMLPDNFSGYYNKYLPPYDSNKFKASLSILKNKYWQTIADVTVIEKDANDPKFKSIKIDLNKLEWKGAASQPEKAIPSFDSIYKDGTLMLKLDYLDFGHSFYPQLITSTVMEKASSKYGAVDFYKIVKRQLRDSVISIKLPDNIDQKRGPFKVVVYDILDNVKDNDQARTMMKNGLSEMIKRFNGSNVITKKARQSGREEEAGLAGEGMEIVNDDNYIERLLGFLKKIKLVNRSIHYDEDVQDADHVVDNLKDKINAVGDSIMPSDKELIDVIISVTNSAINKTVANVVEEILEIREKNGIEPSKVADLIRKEFEEANEVINDMIARKIALLLSANEVPPPPYTPLIDKISASYSSTKRLANRDDQFFHITPLGVIEVNLFGNNKGPHLENEKLLETNFIFPKSFIIDQAAPVEIQGILFISIKDLMLHQNLSVLFQVAEGTKLNDKKPPLVNWWYLRNNKWIKLKDDNLISDSTYGLQTTGIIKFSVPGDINNENKIFNTTALYWLCASTVNNTDAFPRLVNITAQAAFVTFKDQKNDPRHLALPLEANKITSLVNNVPQIKMVSQPISSFNGQVEEQEKEYYTRVSERLRHKARAINNWDYERLVLEHFPTLYKVKCLNNYYSGRFAIGHVTVVPISDLRNKNYTGSNLLIPKTSYVDLREIEQILNAKSSPFVKVHAVNPQLDHVHISCKVKFNTGIDKGYYLKKLNNDLINYLTPWVDGETDSVAFSAKIYVSSIINFIDQREYVDFVMDLVMKQYTENDLGQKIYCINEDQVMSLVETKFTTGHSLLVSAPKHEIELIL